jgi:EAL domain-containing protein (putative c-di-GMP-specific phosphodiesterase class I)
MGIVPEDRYFELFEQMIDCMTDFEHFSRERFVDVLCRLSELFRISKGVTEFYTNEMKEMKGEGEIMCDYDNGEDGVPIIQLRIVSKSHAVIKGTIYRPEHEFPLSEKEMDRLVMIERSLLSFISRNRLSDAIETLGFHDDFGYRNRRSYMRHIEFLAGRGELGGRFTAAMINLLHFTIINQDIGRQNADKVMRRFYEAMREVTGPDGDVSRLGGDNFLVLFRNENTDRFLETINGIPICYDDDADKRVMVEARAGIYRIPEDFRYEAPGDIMDKLMRSYQAAKQSVDATVLYYDEMLGRRKEQDMRIQLLFGPALKNREFRIYYQPKVNVETGEIVGAEALCRWFHEGKMISPADFIPVLEQTTDICALDFYVLESVCADIRRWLDSGWEPVRVSVNLSRKHLINVDLLSDIFSIIDRNDIPHKYIEIELTETTTDVEFRVLKNVVSGLQAQGICTSVDDFGMGYSSLNLIREIPWNVLKIDRCFLPADDESEESVTSLMYRHVVAMARDMGLECITEGVETAKQIEILRGNHCLYAQGFIFDKPLPKEEFEELLSTHRYDISKLLK